MLPLRLPGGKIGAGEVVVGGGRPEFFWVVLGFPGGPGLVFEVDCESWSSLMARVARKTGDAENESLYKAVTMLRDVEKRRRGL